MGIFMLLLLIVVAPILGMISVFLFKTTPWLMGVSIFLIGGGGILRIAYALMFESNSKKSLPTAGRDIDPILAVDAPKAADALPPQRDIPASDYSPPSSGKWLDTTDLEPASVTDGTTKLLEKDQ
jgi:hypothetical protein